MIVSEFSTIVDKAFHECGWSPKGITIKPSDRPDLSDYQCNAPLTIARQIGISPKAIADAVKSRLDKNSDLFSVTVDGPGFLNLRISNNYIVRRISDSSPPLYHPDRSPKIIIDYGGPNIAKPLHVGHLRSAVIGESLKKLALHFGCKVVSDIHLGDWGTPMGMIIAYVEKQLGSGNLEDISRYFETLTPDNLNSIYPTASVSFKNDEQFAARARLITALLQDGEPRIRHIWNQISRVSLAIIKRDFDRLGVSFDLWNGESHAAFAAADLINLLNAKGLIRSSEGALVMDVSRPEDTSPMPPVIIKKSDGALTYAATDLATILIRSETRPDRILYVVDKRQRLHFEQVFRAAVIAGLVNEGVLEHLPFGTVNGSDGKPYKTRQGGVMSLAALIDETEVKAATTAGLSPTEASEDQYDMIKKVALASIKFGDLSNPRTSDYTFEIDKVSQFEGKTGPYILYTRARAASILRNHISDEIELSALTITNSYERSLAFALLQVDDAFIEAWEKRQPSVLCDAVYEISRRFNAFYKMCPVITEADSTIRSSRLILTSKTKTAIEKLLSALSIDFPETMERYSIDA